MAKNNYWLKNGALNIIQNLVTVFIGVGSLYILVRLLSKDQYGTWVLFLSVVSIVEVARNGFTQEALVKYLAPANEVEGAQINTAALAINFGITAIIVVALLFMGPFLSATWNAPEFAHMLQLYSIVFFVSAILSQINCIEQARLHFSGIFYSNVARQVLFLSYISYCYITNTTTNVIALTYVQIICVVCSTLVALSFTIKKIKLSKKLNLDWIKKIFHFGKYSFGVSLTTMIATSLDQMMLASYVSKSASASFNIAVRVSNFVEIPTTAMATIAYPQSAKRIAEEGESSIKYIFERSVGVVLAMLIPAIIFVFFFSEFVIHLLAGHKYDDSIPLIKIIIATYMFGAFSRQTGMIFSSAGKTRLNFYLLLLSFATVIGTNLIFIKAFGAIGIAYAMVVASVINFTVGQLILNKYFNTNPINAFKYAWAFYPEFYNSYVKKILFPKK